MPGKNKIIKEEYLNISSFIYKESAWNLVSFSFKNLDKLRNKSRGHKFPLNFSIFTNTFLFKSKYILQCHHFTLNPSDFRNVHNFTGTIIKTRLLNNHMNSRSNHFFNGLLWKTCTGVLHECFKSRNSISWSIGVNSCHRTIMTSVHRL